MNDLSSWSVVVAGIVSVITTVVVRKVLQGEYSPLGHPVILGCVGLLAFIGLCKFCREQTGWLLVPYAALAISILLVLMFLPFLNKHGEGERAAVILLAMVKTVLIAIKTTLKAAMNTKTNSYQARGVTMRLVDSNKVGAMRIEITSSCTGPRGGHAKCARPSYNALYARVRLFDERGNGHKIYSRLKTKPFGTLCLKNGLPKCPTIGDLKAARVCLCPNCTCHVGCRVLQLREVFI